MDLDGEDSVIARVASLSVKSAASVWNMLEPSFVRWDIVVAEVEGKGKGTKRQPPKPKQESREDEEGLLAPVSEDAWSVLEWLVSLFERDAETTEKEGKGECTNFTFAPYILKRKITAECPDGVFYSLLLSTPITHYSGVSQR